MSKVIGIDLGTTNSCVAIMEGKDVRVIENARARAPRPPWSPSRRMASAWSASPPSARRSPTRSNTLYAIKRLIGRRYDDPMVAKDKGLVPYTIVRGDNGDAWVEVRRREIRAAARSAPSSSAR